jgi:hypothetical protein
LLRRGRLYIEVFSFFVVLLLSPLGIVGGLLLLSFLYLLLVRQRLL